MKSLLKSIRPNETSYRVAALHKVLIALGMSPDAAERSTKTAGSSTGEIVRAIQNRLNIPINNTVLVDNATAAALVRELKEVDLLLTEDSFTVSGKVVSSVGEIVKQQQLLAVDLDLRGVAIYKNVTNLQQILGNEGFEVLGETTSDAQGRYSVTFNELQYAQAERKKADVVVYAVVGESIIGLSRMVNSDDYSDKGLVNNLDVIIAPDPTKTEYGALMPRLTTFLAESQTQLINIAASTDQLSFTAGELDVALPLVSIAAQAEVLRQGNTLSHELLYGLGRQNILLTGGTLFKRKANELRAALQKSMTARIIKNFTQSQINTFIQQLQGVSRDTVLSDTSPNALSAILDNALPSTALKTTFVNALNSFTGTNYESFWSEHLPAQPGFSGNPQLVDNLLFTQQLTLLSGNHQALVHELQVTRNINSVNALFDLNETDWQSILTGTGVPDFVPGETNAQKVAKYSAMIQSLLNTTFPTQRIAKMVANNELSIEKPVVSQKMQSFLSQHPEFNFASSRIHAFDEPLSQIAGSDFEEVRSEMMTLQRIFQLSPSPTAMRVLKENNLASAYSVAGIPRKTFVQQYSEQLGGKKTAFAVHQRATHINAKVEQIAANVREYSHGLTPTFVMAEAEYTAAMEVIENSIPNYAELFGSADICECKHCRSVYSAAAYFVDLLRFLWRGEPNHEGKTPLDMLKERRPDLLYLPLTCENTNTILPYIDLVNEIMEYYTANDSLIDFEGYDTGETTAEELRANPQNFNLEAYRKLNDAKYPFNLPYHQPLNVIRTYSDHLNVSRYDAMQAVNPQPDASTTKAMDAERLGLSPEEYTILAGETFDGTADATLLHEYYGYTTPAEIDTMRFVPEFLSRSGIHYTDLVELVRTYFINPHQNTLTFLESFFSYSSLDANTIYNKLVQIEAGTLDPSTDSDIVDTIAAYNEDNDVTITAAEFGLWVTNHFNKFRQVITLYEPESKCDLETTQLKTIRHIYEGTPGSGLPTATWWKIHRFIRLWRKLGWSIHETDLMLSAIGENDTTTLAIHKLGSVSLLKKETKGNLDLLAVLWGMIDTYGTKSLYKKLFLNKSVQQIDEAFEPDAWGEYLQDTTQVLADHQSALLAAFRITEEDLEAILEIAQVRDGGVPRLLDSATDILTLENVSTLYRYVVLAKLLKLKVKDLCTLITLIDITPFSLWDVQQEKFIDISPDDTYEFLQLAASFKAAGFKTVALEYILTGTLPADSKIGLDTEKIYQTVKEIRNTLVTIDQDHPETPEAELTADTIQDKLSLTFQQEVVSEFIGILQDTALFETITDSNLDIVIPEDLLEKYIYVKGSGRLQCTGVMTDAEQTTLKGLTNANAAFQQAVDELYVAPEIFITDNFNGVFTNSAEAFAVLLDHPAQTPAATLEEKLAYVYDQFIPVIKVKLKRDAITQQIASLIGLSNEATAILITSDIDGIVAALSTEGFSSTYFSDVTLTTAVLDRTDKTIDFAWGSGSPDAAVPVDNFGARWSARLAAPASDEYTLVVEVAEADETFRLYLDEVLILEKLTADVSIEKEVVVTLNAAELHLLTLEYTETTQESGIRLYWKTATRALEIIPGSSAYPLSVLDNFVDQANTLHRAALFINNLSLTEIELDHFMGYASDFDGIDFSAITIAHCKRMLEYIALRNDVPQALALLTDVFVLANTPDPVPTLSELKERLYEATAWDQTNLDFLVDTHFALAVGDFTNETALNRIRTIMKIAMKTGISAETIAVWGAVETDFDAFHVNGQLIKNTVKARYEEEQWLDLAGDLSDRIREQQKQALISYLLVQPAIQAWGVRDADGLFEYFLIDVQMGSCMDTSRIVQANASVQMFVNRCLLNLESNTTSGDETGVSPGAIDKDRWEWMKNYRVWEANRKVFLYPENWLEPEWRNDRSEFFKELESFLVQNDITDRSVEEGFRDYLNKLNDVANLEVCGLHQENYDDGNLKLLHVFARTNRAPYKFFYRTWNEYKKWSAWQSVPLDIRSVEKEKANGVHLLPVVWKKRLFLFWPEFVEIEEAPSGNSNKSTDDLGNDPISTMQSTTKFEIRMGWSEYVDGKWSAKQLSKELIIQKPDDYDFELEKDLLFTCSISAGTQQLTITVSDAYWNVTRGSFLFADIQSTPVTYYGVSARIVTSYEGPYTYKFSNRVANANLTLEDDTYLNRIKNHAVLPVDSMKGLDISLSTPFFYSESKRTYFVRPVPITIIEWLRDPWAYNPFIPLPDDNQSPPLDIPNPDPGDFLPDDFLPGSMGIPGSMEVYGEITASAGTPGFYGYHTKQAQPNTLRSVNVNRAVVATDQMGKAEIASVDPPFWEDDKLRPYDDWIEGPYSDLDVRADKGLEFHTFYHPFSGDYVTNLNQGGMGSLLESDTEILSDEGSVFETTYDPNFTSGFVQKPADFAERTYYKENVCFDVYGANSLYNWELFFHAPLYVATRLSKNGKYEEAMKWFHYIFDPTTDALPAAGESETARYWKVLPFKTTPSESLEDFFKTLLPNNNPDEEDAIIGEWRDNPFDPHLVASNRPLAYMKHVVIKYVDNLIAWGDSLFRRDTMESVNEALQIYVIANHVLGPRPEFVPVRGTIKAESYESLKDKWDDFSNALVELENIFPYSSDTSASASSAGGNLLGIGETLYFCIPSNEKLLYYWDTVADRLFKIRHCQNIDGVERKLALFAPPIDPAALVAAASAGLSLGSILADLSSPPPIYRFTFLIQKANDFCANVKTLGSALLSALEKKDSEELSRLRASHETNMLELMTGIRERQVLDAKANKENLLKTRALMSFRLNHYLDLLGNTLTVPTSPSMPTTLTADSPIPTTVIASVATDVDESLVESNESGIKLIPREKEDIDKSKLAMISHQIATGMEGLAGLMNFIPNFSGEFAPFGVGVSISFGGSNIAGGISGLAKIPQIAGNVFLHEANKAAKMGSFIRREQEWTLQANLAAKEIEQVDKQIVSADIRIQIAEKELENHKQQIEDAKAVELFLKDKFTNQELYQWMKEQLFSVYKQSYNLAYEMARKAEKAYKYELGLELSNFIQYGYWDNAKQGLVSGDKLQLALTQLEKSYFDENRRELELTRSISLAMLNPLALIELRETGKCYITLPEQLFDLDFQGHYFRRIKSVSLSIPCIAGPYTSVSCTLRLLNNTTRINTAMNSAGTYEHENDEGVWIDDMRFRSSNVPVTSIATCTGQTDDGLFEFNFRDERYLPFEGAGLISDWVIELAAEKELRQFDYETIADLILHVNYTARESGGLFYEAAVEYTKNFLLNSAELSDQPLMRMFSMKHEFSTEWHKFLYPATEGGEQLLTFTIGRERLPFLVRDREITVMKIDVFARCTNAGDYHLILLYTDEEEETVTSSQMVMPPDSTYGELNRIPINVNDAGLNLEELDIDGAMSLKLKQTTSPDYTALATMPDEVEDVYLVIHYKLG